MARQETSEATVRVVDDTHESNLLFLLRDHAEIEAKIEVPDDWVDPVPDI
jgi:hypothetical protein